MSEQAKHTPIPWQCSNRNWRNEEHEHNWYITGDHHESVDTDDDGNDVDGGPSCTSVAIVVGNATSGGIPQATAEFICRAVNNHERLLEACKALPFDVEFDDAADFKDNAHRFMRAMDLAAAAIAADAERTVTP